jgi:hypothetical protein
MKRSTSTKDFDWAVIGAGPAGIAAVGKLLDSGVHPKRLAWIDPTFTVGDFGVKWRNVPSNTTVGLFTKYLLASQAFNYAECHENFALNNTDPSQTCFLRLMDEPLQWVTQQLMQQVIVVQDLVEELQMKNQHWNLTLSKNSVQTKNVVLALGAEPKTLSNPGVETISLEVAMDREKLAKHCTSEDTIAVFGSSHSAVLIIRGLLESCSVKKVINFYRAPLRYAVDLGDEILFDDTGLKGTTAEWARANLHGTPPEKLQQVFSSQENIEHYLPHCNKAIYAVGFARRGIVITGLGELEYNPYNGIIAPGLFGLGIAFPQAKTDRFGNLEYRVGLWKFMDYLSTILPVWMRYPV